MVGVLGVIGGRSIEFRFWGSFMLFFLLYYMYFWGGEVFRFRVCYIFVVIVFCEFIVSFIVVFFLVAERVYSIDVVFFKSVIVVVRDVFIDI